jgi:hypothetical protein
MHRIDNFRAVIAEHPEVREEISQDTLDRYLKNRFPKGIQWMRRYPFLLYALYVDAVSCNEITHHTEAQP